MPGCAGGRPKQATRINSLEQCKDTSVQDTGMEGTSTDTAGLLVCRVRFTLETAE